MKRFDMVMLGAINLNLALLPVDQTVFSRDVTKIPNFGATPGGDAMNEAIAAAHLGNRVALCGKVGDDYFGGLLLAEAKRHGIDTSGVVRAKQESTAVGTQLVSEYGARHIISFRGAMESYCLEEVRSDIIRQASILSIGSLNILKQLEGKGITAILKEAKQAGLLTSADTMSDTYGFGFDMLKPHFPFLDYFVPSVDEASSMSGERDVKQMAACFRKLGCRTVVIKMGSDGCYVDDGIVRAQVAAYQTKVVDTTGAGDNFVAGFLTAIKHGESPREAAKYGNAVAALSVQHVGSSGAIQSPEQVEEFQKTHHYLG